MTKQLERTGAEELRAVVSIIDGLRESFNDRFTAEQLLKLVRMHWASEWDIPPDEWTPRQIRESLRGKPPRWDDGERPVYGKSAVTVVARLAGGAR